MEISDLFYDNAARCFDKSTVNSTYIILNKDYYPLSVHILFLSLSHRFFS